MGATGLNVDNRLHLIVGSGIEVEIVLEASVNNLRQNWVLWGFSVI
jgi:hypothetical protein